MGKHGISQDFGREIKFILVSGRLGNTIGSCSAYALIVISNGMRGTGNPAPPASLILKTRATAPRGVKAMTGEPSGAGRTLPA